MDRRKLQHVRSLLPNLTRSTSDVPHLQSHRTCKRKNSELPTSMSLDNSLNPETEARMSEKTSPLSKKQRLDSTEETSKKKKITSVSRSTPSTSAKMSSNGLSMAERKLEGTSAFSSSKPTFSSSKSRSRSRSRSPSPSLSLPRAERSPIRKKKKSIITSHEEEEEEVEEEENDIFESQKNSPERNENSLPLVSPPKKSSARIGNLTEKLLELSYRERSKLCGSQAVSRKGNIRTPSKDDSKKRVCGEEEEEEENGTDEEETSSSLGETVLKKNVDYKSKTVDPDTLELTARSRSQKETNPRTGRDKGRNTGNDTDKEFAKSRVDGISGKSPFATPQGVSTASGPSSKTDSPRRAVSSSSTGFLIKFLEECGLKLVPEEAPILIFDDIPAVRNKIGESLDGKYRSRQREIKKCIEEYLEDEGNLESAVRAIKVQNERGTYFTSYNTTLVGTLLQITALQPALIEFLLSTLHVKVVTADSTERLPWVRPLIYQFRFLEEIAEPGRFTDALQDIIETTPTWFQKEFIPYLTDIIIDSQHRCIAESMIKSMEANHELTTVVLDCIEQLNLGKEFSQDLTDKVLTLMKDTLDNKLISPMVGFVLSGCATMESSMKILSILRTVELEPLPNEKAEDAYKHQLLTMEKIQMHMLLTPRIASAAFNVVKSVKNDPQPLDLITLLVLFKIQKKKKKKAIEVLLRQHVKAGIFRVSLLKTVYKDFKEVARSLQAPAMELASNLLKSEESFSEFAIEWFRWQIKVLSGLFFRQREVIDKLKQLIGNSDKTSRTVLSIFSRMAAEEEERKCLQEHCNHLKALLDKMDNLDFVGIAILSDLLHGLCKDSTRVADALQDDLGMLLQKQLSDADPLIKCRGVMGVVMSIKHLAEDPNTAEKGFTLFKAALETMTRCPRAQALFYDEMAKVALLSQKIHSEFLERVSRFAKDLFVDDCTVEAEAYSGNCTAQFGLEESGASQEYALDFGNGKRGPVIPALFHLLRVCCLRKSKDGQLDEINALLGCSIYMPKDLQEPEPIVLDHLIYCINWFREIIGGFVTQTDRQLQKRVLQRVDHLMSLQGELNVMLALCGGRYQPPPCYFHQFPIPSFVKTDKRVAKKGKNKGNADKTTALPEWESWEKGCLLSSKNPSYFRRLDAKIAHLLDMRMNLEMSETSPSPSPSPPPPPPSSAPHQSITISQVCFVIKELLGMLEFGTTDILIRDLVNLLPKICAKLRNVVSELRNNDDVEKREAVRLILNLLTMLLKWKGFENSVYNSLLREALRTLAGQTNASNATLRHCRELVAESYNYFESLNDICTHIPLAIALVDVCSAVMKHSESFVKNKREKQAHLAYGFLCLNWPDDKHKGSAYNSAVRDLLKNWFANEPCQLTTVSKILEWLPAEVDSLKAVQDQLHRLPSINKLNFHLLFHRIIAAMIQGVKSSLSTANSDPRRIEIWHEATENLHSIVKICKQMKTKSNIGLFLRLIPTFVSYFTSTGMPVMEHNLKYQQNTVTQIVKTVQGATRYLNTVCVDCTQRKDTLLSKYIPAAKGAHEKFVYSVKGMLVLNNSSTAFWMGNLINKNLEGVEILSQASSSEDSTVEASVTDVNDDIESDILSDVENDENVDEENAGNAKNQGGEESESDNSLIDKEAGGTDDESDETSEILENDF